MNEFDSRCIAPANNNSAVNNWHIPTDTNRIGVFASGSASSAIHVNPIGRMPLRSFQFECRFGFSFGFSFDFDFDFDVPNSDYRPENSQIAITKKKTIIVKWIQSKSLKNKPIFFTKYIDASNFNYDSSCGI